MLKSFLPRSRKYFTTMRFTLFLFAVFAVVWFYVYNRYAVLYYQEQIQLFRFEKLYFLSYLDRPGGISKYIGAFLTQFYFYPLAGALILTTVLITVVLLFYHICRSCGNIRRLFFILFIPAVLLMTSFVNVFFDMSLALGIMFALAGFSWYIVLSKSVRYGAGMILLAAIYFIAGGNVLLLAALIIIFELTLSSAFKTPTFLYLLLLTGWTVLLPFLSRHLFYTVTMREAYFALTPANSYLPSIDSKLLWLSIPALYLVWRLIANSKIQVQTSKFQLFNHSIIQLFSHSVIQLLLVSVMTLGCAYAMYNRRSNIINRMAFDLQNGNYKSVIAVGKDNPTNNRLVCYLTNIALYESGQMPYRMFHYKQMGTASLLLNWEFASSSILVWFLGEVYYRLGMIPQAEHCAFESFVSSHKELDVKVLQRLTLTNIARRDSATADKYLQYLEHSLFYRDWARQQRINLNLAMADSTFHIPGMPIPVHCKDFFIPYQMPEFSLLMLLESNPKHRMAFEYLMAYCMLERDLKKVKWCMDNYYRNFDYPAIPTHYEEALLLYKNVYDSGPDFFTQYPISSATRDRYDRYMLAVNAARNSKRKFEQFQKQFGNTFWYYMNLIDPKLLKK